MAESSPIIEEVSISCASSGANPRSGVHLISDEKALYSIGSIVVVHDIRNHSQKFFTRHDAEVTSLASWSGYCISGQKRKGTKKQGSVYLFDSVHPDTSFVELLYHSSDIDSVGIGEGYVFVVGGDSVKSMAVWRLSDVWKLGSDTACCLSPWTVTSFGRERVSRIVVSSYQHPDEVQLATVGSVFRVWGLSKHRPEISGTKLKEGVTCASFTGVGLLVVGLSQGGVGVGE